MLNIRHLPLSFLLGASFLLGCPKKNPTEPEGLNPQVEFVQGVKKLQTPDRKTGEIDYATAFAFFQSAVNLKPEFANAAYNAGWAAEQMGKTTDAVTYYQKAYDTNPSKQFLEALSDAMVVNGQSDDSIALYQTYVEQNPTDAEARYDLIKALTASGKTEDALVQASEILTLNSEDITVYRLLSRAFYQSGQYDMSLLCAEKANEMLMDVAKKTGQQVEKDPGILNNMGVTYLTMKDEPKAIDAFQQAIGVEVNHVEANLNLGFIALNSGNYTYALERFDATLVKDTNNFNAKIGRAIALRGIQDFGEAKKLYNQLLESDKNARIVYFNAATLEAKYNKDYKAAQKLLETYQSKNPSDPDVAERLAELSTLQEEEARKAAEEAARKKAEAERQKRQQEKMNELKTAVSTLQADAESLGSCPDAVESGAVEMAMMVLEQGNMVIEANEIEMAADVIPFILDTQESLNALKDVCGGGGGGEAPTPETPGEETPAPE